MEPMGPPVWRDMTIMLSPQDDSAVMRLGTPADGSILSTFAE